MGLWKLATCLFQFVNQMLPQNLPPNATLLCHDGWYATAYNEPYKLPLWSAYHVTPKNLSDLQGGRRGFMLDPLVPSNEQAPVDSDAFNTTYNRGHLCPSYIMSWNKSTDGPWYNTYRMTNVAPQYGTFNQQQWEHIEASTVDWIQQTQRNLYIFTGTGLWEFTEKSAREHMSYDGIVVPDFYFKVMCQPDDQQSRGIIAANNKTANGWNVSVAVNMIEQITGYQFFPEKECRTEMVDETYWELPV